MKQAENKYIGMSLEELERQEVMYKQFIEGENKAIQEHKRAIKSYNEQLKRIEEAKQAVANIEVCNICEVEKTKKKFYVGDGKPKGYYSAADWKEYVWYKVGIYRCNVNDRRKSRALLWTIDFAATDKSRSIAIMIKNFKDYSVKKIVLGKDDKFPITLLKKEIEGLIVEYV